MTEIKVPLSVPRAKRGEYLKNFRFLTNGSGRLFLIAGDQKVEHLNDDFFGAGISPEDGDPEHLFKVAAASHGGVLATHPGLISRYGADYRQIPYLIKLNGKTNIGSDEKDSSDLWWTVDDVVSFRQESGLNIVGIGYTLYLGGKNEGRMLAAAARLIYRAHQAGLTAVVWVYPRAKGIQEENIHTIAGGAGVAASLDADFIKVKYPYGRKDKAAVAKGFKEVVLAAGRSKVICVGGGKKSASELIDQVARQLEAGSSGLAMGRNMHQRPLQEAVRLNEALGALVFHGKKAKEALDIYNGKKKTRPVKSASRFLGIF